MRVEKRKVQLDTGTDSPVVQSMKDETDINTIIRNYGKTGALGYLNPAQPTYGDVSEMVDLQEAIELVKNAERQFYALPAEVRDAAQNDPVKLLEMLADPDGVAKLKELGLPMKEEPTKETPKPEPTPA